MSAPEIRIRRALVEDLELVQRFIRELAAYERLEQDCTGTAGRLKEMLFGAVPRAEVLLAFANGQPAGFAVYLFTFSTFAARPILYLEDFFVKPELRGCGVGTQLFAALASVAEQHDCLRIDWTVLDWNETAIRFYDRIGARPQKQWLKYSLEAAQFPAVRERAVRPV